LGDEHRQQRGARSALQFAYWGLQKKDPAIADQMLKSANLSQPEIEALSKTRSPF
jgi:hypothetical protein